ncbi:unnamed protein product [Paramecium primaurelia]|uniref:PX domain-containing protein n=1 Tax=Paramecium primaurelia TaxID=5886 RepID=A0A8S1NQT2_PARPR|nr:unnamed protein product [Paramecium primaurelia]
MCIVYSTQVAGILYEYNKNVPIMFTHKIFWIICLITNIVQAILNVINQKDFDILSNIVLYLIIVDQFSLNIFSIFIRKQDKIEFEDISGLGMTVPDYEDSRQQMIPIQNSFIGLSSSHSQFKCTIHFSKTWKIVQQKDGQIDAVITLKIFLSNPNKHYQLKKTINDFVMLESRLQQEDKFGFEIYKLPNDFFHHGPDTNQMFNEKIAMIKIWLRQIISKIEYLTPSIYDFLEFDDTTRVCIIKDQRNKSNSLDQSN